MRKTKQIKYEACELCATGVTNLFESLLLCYPEKWLCCLFQLWSRLISCDKDIYFHLPNTISGNIGTFHWLSCVSHNITFFHRVEHMLQADCVYKTWIHVYKYIILYFCVVAIFSYSRFAKIMNNSPLSRVKVKRKLSFKVINLMTFDTSNV